MKFNAGETTVIVGKRVAVGAVFGSIAKIVATIYPDYAVVAYEASTVLTFVAQITLANFFTHTSK